ncbi:MAG: UDP binding domain-containing protein, partial [Longimicrobiales bacterium]
VGVLGLTYKSGTSTLRRSAALDLITDLARSGVAARAFDPLAELDSRDAPAFTRVGDPYAAADDADALVFVTPWQGIEALDLKALRARMRRPVFIDTRNHFDPERLAHHGFIYLGVGRGVSLVGARAGVSAEVA